MPHASRTINKKRLTSNSKEFSQFSILNSQFYKRGFTLIEILLALIFILVIIAILFSASGTFTTSRSSNLQSIAAKIASREIETLRNTSFDSLPSSGPISDSDLSKLPSGTASRTILDYGSPADPKIKQVSIQVNWTFNGAPREIKMDTLISENGL